MSYIIKEVNVKGKLFSDFLHLPEEIYSDDPHWVAPLHSEMKRLLDPGENPYFENVLLKIFVCYSDEKPVARSILVINKNHWKRWNQKCSFFGFFEAFNDLDSVKALFGVIESESRLAGADSIIGPFNPNHYSELGILADNFDSEQLFFETYNKSWYPSLLENSGFSIYEKFHTMINRDIKETFKKEIPIPPVDLKSSGIRIRKFNIFRFRKELEIIRDINNDAFGDNWHFLPLSADEYRFSGKFLFFVTKPSMVQIAEYKGKAVGVTQFVLNMNAILKSYRGRIRLIDYPVILLKRSRIKEVIVFTFGIKKKFQKTRIATAMIAETTKILTKYPVAATTWMSEKNRSAVRSAEALSLKPYKQFNMYSKALNIYHEDI
jgi:hypothetical protein